MKSEMISQPTEKVSGLPIEPRIWPLVKALNDSGLVKTFSSCEGHDPARRKKENTNPLLVGPHVLFRMKAGHDAFEQFAAIVYADFSTSPVAYDAPLTIFRHYSGMVGDLAVYGFSLQPRTPDAPWAEQRTALDNALLALERVVRKHSSQ